MKRFLINAAVVVWSLGLTGWAEAKGPGRGGSGGRGGHTAHATSSTHAQSHSANRAHANNSQNSNHHHHHHHHDGHHNNNNNWLWWGLGWWAFGPGWGWNGFYPAGAYGGYGWDNYNMYPGVYDTFGDPIALRTMNRVRLQVVLPDPEAALWLNGQAMTPRGAARLFESPPLEPGKQYTYDVTAAWSQDGKIITKDQKVAVTPGKTTVVSFAGP